MGDKDAYLGELERENVERLGVMQCDRLNGKCLMQKVKMTIKLSVVLCSLLFIIPGQTCRAKVSAEAGKSPRIVNIINFVRQCEPRIDWITEDVLYDTVVSQIESMKQHQLRGTFLLQYDALMDARYQKLLKALPADQFEIGTWWERQKPSTFLPPTSLGPVHPLGLRSTIIGQWGRALNPSLRADSWISLI